MTFKIQRDTGYRNSFLPIVRGQIDERASDTLVLLRMTVHPFVAAFGATWLIGVGAFAVVTGSALAVAMLGFGGLLGTVPFYAEALIATRSLREELGARGPRD